MKLLRTLAQATLASVVLVLTASCGGGNEQDRGSLTAFNIVPTEITLTWTTPGCGVSDGGRVYVYGGAGPYRVNNTGAATANGGALFTVSKTRLDRPGDYFEVQNITGCMSNISVVVVDQLGRQAVVTVTSTDGS